jgi:hypothetical protein
VHPSARHFRHQRCEALHHQLRGRPVLYPLLMVLLPPLHQSSMHSSLMFGLLAALPTHRQLPTPCQVAPRAGAPLASGLGVAGLQRGHCWFQGCSSICTEGNATPSCKEHIMAHRHTLCVSHADHSVDGWGGVGCFLQSQDTTGEPGGNYERPSRCHRPLAKAVSGRWREGAIRSVSRRRGGRIHRKKIGRISYNLENSQMADPGPLKNQALLLTTSTPQPKPPSRLPQRRQQGPPCLQYRSPAPGRNIAHAYPQPQSALVLPKPATAEETAASARVSKKATAGVPRRPHAFTENPNRTGPN